MAHYYDPADETIEGGAGMRDYHRTSPRLLLPGEKPGLAVGIWPTLCVCIVALALGYYLGGGCVGGLG